MSKSNRFLTVGQATVELLVEHGCLTSLGAISVHGVALRQPTARFLPWFDSYNGEVFDRFEFVEVKPRGEQTVVALRAIANDNFPFREQRDCSGDLCFRNLSVDAAPVVADFAIVFQPATTSLAGHAFAGFTYWFEYNQPACPIHRLLDRATWELGGNLDDLNLVCRNWLTPPRLKIGRDTVYSTVGLDKWATLLPGNMWARWSLLPGFDLQYGQAGVLVGCFDQVSLIRTAIESNAGEDAIRCNDFHWFENSGQVATNPKTILHSTDQLDHTDALNLWTALQDRDREIGRRQFGIAAEEPPRLTESENVWRGYHFDTTYEPTLAVAAEFGMDQIFVDVCWEQGQALKESFDALLPPDRQRGTIFAKYQPRNMCCVLDFAVAEAHGGEAALKRLCERAASQGLKVISWMAAHVHPHSIIVDGRQCLEDADNALPLSQKFAHGKNGAIAAMESGRHPSTGYPNSCWTLNLNSPVYRYFADSILGVCQRTGLDGFLWDSFSNLGWWQVDYADGSMRPQFDKMAELYAELTRTGLYVQPEAIVSFSSHSCCGLHGGDVYAGDLLGYSYDTVISLHRTDADETAILRGQAPVDRLFRCLAHRRVPGMSLHQVPRAEWQPAAVAAIKEYFAAYKLARKSMRQRTVLKDDRGVLWQGADGERLLWSFQAQEWPDDQPVDLLDGRPVPGGRLAPWRVYRLQRQD